VAALIFGTRDHGDHSLSYSASSAFAREATSADTCVPAVD